MRLAQAKRIKHGVLAMMVSLDFSLGLSPPFVSGKYLRHGRVSVSHGWLPPRGDELFEVRQVTTALHIRPRMRLEWRVPPNESQSGWIRQGMAHISGTGGIVRWRWADPAEMVAVAIDSALLADVATACGVMDIDIDIDTVVGVVDEKISHLSCLFDHELRDGGSNGRLYLESLGAAPHRFLIERRVARARPLLADPHLSVAEIALMLGFADQSHFTEHFRRLTGITHARFRRNL